MEYANTQVIVHDLFILWFTRKNKELSKKYYEQIEDEDKLWLLYKDVFLDEEDYKEWNEIVSYIKENKY